VAAGKRATYAPDGTLLSGVEVTLPYSGQRFGVPSIEEAASKAHVDPHALDQARADLGIVASRANTGGVQAVQWSLPG